MSFTINYHKISILSNTAGVNDFFRGAHTIMVETKRPVWYNFFGKSDLYNGEKTMLTLITGGSGSGKSEYAENTAVGLQKKMGAEKLYYLAAMKPFGEEAEKRIEKHRVQRAGKGFETVENYYASMPCISKNSVVLLECLSNLTANEYFGRDNKNAEDDIFGFIKLLSENCASLVVVTNDVFSDGMSYDKSVTEYMAVLGNINRRIAEIADGLFEVVCGIPVKLK